MVSFTRFIVLLATLYCVSQGSDVPLPAPGCELLNCFGDCKVIDGKAQCVPHDEPIFTPFPLPISCANILCSPGFKCIDTKNGPKCVPFADCFCAQIFDPVCCRLPDGSTVDASNSCECTCHKKGKVVPCGGGTCACPKILKPVCCSLKEGLQTTSNECLCTCQGGVVISEKECARCLCPAIEGGSCCKIKDIIFTAPSPCQCACNGGVAVNSKKCKH